MGLSLLWLLLEARIALRLLQKQLRWMTFLILRTNNSLGSLCTIDARIAAIWKRDEQKNCSAEDIAGDQGMKSYIDLSCMDCFW